LISRTHGLPGGGRATFDGWHGSIKPEGRRRWTIAGGWGNRRAVQPRQRPASRRWRAYPNFYFDVGRRPSWRHLLIRDDPTGEFEPGNARWRVARWYRRR
jgi:hypothetical protein